MHILSILFFSLLVFTYVTLIKTIPNVINTIGVTSQLLKDFSNSVRGGQVLFQDPPQYMLDLYNSVADSNGITKSPLPFGATLVRAIPVQGYHGKSFSYTLDSIPPEEKILEAEIHIYHRHLSYAQRKALGKDNVFKLNVYMSKDAKDFQLLSSQNVGAHFYGRKIFAAGDALRKAKINHRDVFFMVEASTLDDVPIVSKIHHGRYSSTSPLLVLFNKVVNNSALLSDVSERFSSKDRNKFSRSNRVIRSAENEFEKSQNTIPSGCELRSLQVDFEKIGWAWVVYPKIYDAHHCVGRCAFPLGQDLHPTNHATVVSIVHYFSEDTDDVNNVSCIPTSYEALALLYYDEKDTVILKHFDRMIATQCGCR